MTYLKTSAFNHVICNQTRKVLERRTADRQAIVDAFMFSMRCHAMDRANDMLPFEILGARDDALEDAAYAMTITNYRLAVDHLRTFWRI